MKEYAEAATELTEDLSAADIVSACERWVPVNAHVGTAIVAHRITFQEHGRRASYALRAVTLARTPTVADQKQILAYLTALPIEAWEGEVIDGRSAQEWRDDTLRAITRSLTWMLER
jgi:hypothetical protein